MRFNVPVEVEARTPEEAEKIVLVALGGIRKSIRSIGTARTQDYHEWFQK